MVLTVLLQLLSTFQYSIDSNEAGIAPVPYAPTLPDADILLWYASTRLLVSPTQGVFSTPFVPIDFPRILVGRLLVINPSRTQLTCSLRI